MRYLPATIFGVLGTALAPTCAHATFNAPDHVWSKSFGAAGKSTRGFGIAVDASRNVLVTGSFTGTVNFGGANLAALGTDIVLAKYDAAGAHVWSKRFGGSGADQAYAVAVDHTGNILIVGYFQGTANFGGSNITSTGNSDAFVAKYDPNGTHLWSRWLGTPEADQAYAVAIDDAGDVYLTGYVHGVVPSDIFIAKYDPAGTMAWFKILGGPGYDEGLSLDVDGPGNVVVTGSFEGEVDFGGGVLSTPGADWDGFIAKYDPTGAHLWSRRFGDIDYDAGVAVKIDNAGNAFLTGYFQGAVSFGGAELVSVGNDVDIFLAKYDEDGNHLWSERFGGMSYESGYGLAVDDNSNVFMTGYFDGTANLGGQNLVSDGSVDIFFAEYDAEGQHVSSQRYGDTTGDTGQAIAIDDLGNRYITGYYDGAVDFGGGELVALGTPDMFVVKYGRVTSAAGPALDALSVSAMPNPFNPTTTIHYRVPAAGRVNVTLFDVHGRLIETLLDEEMSAGPHTVTWNGRDHAGQSAASGVYFARVVHGGVARTLKLVLLK